ncbi:DUF6090 family protein [Croceivirga thetidis]|uniref:Uncharacterized protein n=1 Tax=Croceivirga thetidis TaxID=2721623 RepID=A0ABX1GPI3_9FLAO|nr:DUF6090 family protein [Croceivirga thetidis]NKI30951.1 hypothetical protein [Croceivirga thetidis]
MIKFFRRIRQKLLAENKFSKYLLYAVGEIILVVIGILIALQVNNWNEERKSIKKEELFLTEIRNSLVSDSTQITEILEFNKGKVKIVQGFMGLFADTLSPDQRFTIIEKYTRPFTEYQVFLPNKTAWNNLITSERLNLIQNRDLRTLLMEYYAFDYDSSVQERLKFMNRKVVDEVFPKFFTKEFVAKNLGITTDFPSKDENKLHLNQTFLSDLYGIVYLINLQNEFLKDINLNITEALELIDKQLE